MFDIAAADKLFVIGYHMPFPGIGTVEKNADGYRWAPVAASSSCNGAFRLTSRPAG